MKVESLPLHYYPYLVGILSVICISSFTMNSVVMATFYRVPSFGTASHYLMLSMVVDDWLRSVFVLPVAIYANYVHWWTLSEWYCQYFAFTSTFLGLNSMIHLTALAMERWRRTAKPLAVRPNKKDTIWMILALWLFALIWSVFPVIGWSSYSPEPGYFGCSVTWHSTATSDRAFTGCLFIIFFIIPLIKNLYCYINIYVQIRFLSRRDSDRWGDQSLATTETQKAKNQCTKIALCMVSGFLFAWSPYAFVSMCTLFGYNVTPLAAVVAGLFAKTSSIFNPLILVFLHKRFRETLKILLFPCFCKGQPLPNSDVSLV